MMLIGYLQPMMLFLIYFIYNELNHSLVSNSNYYIEDSFNDMVYKFRVTSEKISFVYHNCRNLNAHSGDLLNLLEELITHKLSIIGRNIFN